MSTFTIRPSNSEKEAFRVKLTAVSLLGLRVKPGDLCSIKLAGSEGSPAVSRDLRDAPLRYAIAWEASGTGMKDSIVQMSKLLQELYGFKLGDKVALERCGEGLKEADVVRLKLIAKGGWEEKGGDEQRKFWEFYAKFTVKEAHDCVAESQVLVFEAGKERREFEVVDVGVGGRAIARVVQETRFEIMDHGGIKTREVKFTGSGIGGLKKEVDEMQKLVTRLLKPKISSRYSPVQGALVYGAKGVGKSHFIQELASSGWSSIIRWTAGTKITTPLQPTLIMIDQLDLPSPQHSSKPLLREISQVFSLTRNSPCMIVGEARHPNDIDPYLRSEGKFSVELEIPIPSAPQRKEILLSMRSSETQPPDTLIRQMSDRTHGYVAADLKLLMRLTLEIASESNPPTISNGTSSSSTSSLPTESDPPPSFTVSEQHLLSALSQTRPSALQEIFLETPTTTYADISGQYLLKQRLQNAVQRPLLQASRMAKLGLRPKKGVLLYGPPGCSKTLLVRALANEAGLNFLAVKGAELISMYVGESERATREVFRKARAARPSIIFFDEIDAIASRTRTGGSSTGGELNVLTTLLNEIDGFEELRGVFVVAATNKPENIDGALLRPGRFDDVVYVGPPDEETRRLIFLKELSGANYVVGGEGESLEKDARDWSEQTEEYSGAEIVAICQNAAEAALDDDRDWVEKGDVQRAVEVMPKSITNEMLKGFEAWNAARMR